MWDRLLVSLGRSPLIAFWCAAGQLARIAWTLVDPFAVVSAWLLGVLNSPSEASVGDLDRVREQLADVTGRHDVLLELLGEKEEELEEMRSEFEDVKVRSLHNQEC